MSKGIILDEAFIQSIGLGDQLLTLSGPIENKVHPILQEPMFYLNTMEVEQTIYLERRYVFENQVSIKSSYGKGDRILVWQQRVLRVDPTSSEKERVELLMVRDLFMLNEWREFHRFKAFIKSMRIHDAQSRNWLTDHHQEFPAMVDDRESVQRILDCLISVAEWPDLDGVSSTNDSLEQLAKTYSKGLVPVRSCPLMPELLLAYAPDVRFRLFRLMSFVEDSRGALSLMNFLTDLGRATGDPAVIEATKEPRSGRGLQRALTVMRQYLLSAKMPQHT